MPELADAVTAAADLGRRQAERSPDPYSLDAESRLVIDRVRDDEQLRTLDLEPFLPAPLAPRGDAVTHVVDDFCRYVNRLVDLDHTTVWCDMNRNRIVAVLDDHADHAAAGWRRHTVRLALQPEPDWLHWGKLHGKTTSQAGFAEHIEDGAHSVVQPSAADMLELATSMQAKRNVTFSQGSRLSTGDVALTFEEETQAKAGARGQLEIPERFTIRVAPWTFVDPVDMTARLRWRIERGALQIGYTLLRPDRVMQDAFAGLVAKVRDQVEVQVLIGEPPSIGDRERQPTEYGYLDED